MKRFAVSMLLALAVTLLAIHAVAPKAHVARREQPRHLRHHHAKQYRRSPWQTMTVLVTQYVVRHDAGCDTYTDRTANGKIANRGTIAVDTRVFRFGTKFRIPGYGTGVAEDTGNAVIGRHIDAAVYSCHEALKWGVKRIKVQYRNGV